MVLADLLLIIYFTYPGILSLLVAFCIATSISVRELNRYQALLHGFLVLVWFILISLMIGTPHFNADQTKVSVINVSLFATSLWGLYLGYKKGSIAIGILWMFVGVCAAVYAAYYWLKFGQIISPIFYTMLAIISAILATRAISLHWARDKLAAMTSFYGADLTNAKFVNARLENCDFRNANLEGVDWSGATFKKCKFPRNWEGISPRNICGNIKDEGLSINHNLSNVSDT